MAVNENQLTDEPYYHLFLNRSTVLNKFKGKLSRKKNTIIFTINYTTVILHYKKKALWLKMFQEGSEYRERPAGSRIIYYSPYVSIYISSYYNPINYF